MLIRFPMSLSIGIANDLCLRLHFHFCVRGYLGTPPPGAPTHFISDAEDMLDDMGLYDGYLRLPELRDPVWDSPLGREVLRSLVAQRCAYFSFNLSTAGEYILV